MNNTTTQWLTLNNLALKYNLSDPSVLNTTACNTYLKEIELIDILPFSKGTIRFSSDIWDFSFYSTLNISKNELCFRFTTFPLTYKKLAKQFSLVTIINNKNKIQTVVNKCRCLKQIFIFFEKQGLNDIQDISKDNINDLYLHLEEKKLSLTSIDNYQNALKDFFLFYHNNIQNLRNPNLLDILSSRDKIILNAWRENHKAKLIPTWYYNKLLAGLIHYMNDSACPYIIKGPACLFIILSQTGLRESELLHLSTNCIVEKLTFNGEMISYLCYDSWKGVKGNNSAKQCFTYINPICKKAIETLICLPEYKKRRKNWDIDYLYCGTSKTSKNSFPLSPDSFNKQSKKLWIQLDNDGYLETINLPIEKYPYLGTTNRKRKTLKSKRTGETIITISCPTTQQFRFHVITELYEKGVPIPYIKRFMSHLTEDMTNYHIHKGNKVQEDLEAAKKVLSGIVTGDEKIIGGDKGLTANIQKFIEENHFNVEKDLDAIVSKLAEDIPIRIKTGGVCIKSSRFRPCSIDSRTDEMYCAYNVCPNIFHFFYHCGVTWRKCKELKEAIDINEKRGLLKWVYKDTNNLRSIISHQLLPEMDELQVQLKEKGINTIYEKYPDLIDIIENFDEIKKEVTLWLQQTQQK